MLLTNILPKMPPKTKKYFAAWRRAAIRSRFRLVDAIILVADILVLKVKTFRDTWFIPSCNSKLDSKTTSRLKKPIERRERNEYPHRSSAHHCGGDHFSSACLNSAVEGKNACQRNTKTADTTTGPRNGAAKIPAGLLALHLDLRENLVLSKWRKR